MAVKNLVNMTQTVAVEGINQTTNLAVTASGVSREFYEFASADAAIFYVDCSAVTGTGTPSVQFTLQERDPATGLFFNATDPAAPVSAGAAFAAAAAASVTLPAGASYLTGFDIDIGAATAAGVSTVTVSNVAGGNLVYPVEQPYASAVAVPGAALSIRYPGTGLQASGGLPTVAIGATTGGGAGTVNAYGTGPVFPLITATLAVPQRIVIDPCYAEAYQLAWTVAGTTPSLTVSVVAQLVTRGH